jgi:signal transduction histidine kinase
MGDPNLLEQVLTNLIGNAVKFSPHDSDVYVRSLATPMGWRMEIEDRGMGIRAADLPTLFNRFVRGSNAKEAHTQGAGLGLFVSKAIIEAHGGTINLTSREGEGTTVAYDLPRQRFFGSTEQPYDAYSLPDRKCVRRDCRIEQS